jgi:imidazoleglycerol phosphate synthase glutamine amidotransferase subunit HisH
MGQLTLEMTVLEVICRPRETEKVFRNYDTAAGVCLCCQALFDSLEELARKYGLDLEKLLVDLEMAAAGRSDR